MKRIVCCLLIMCMIISCSSFVSADEPILIEAESYVDYEDNNTGNKARPPKSDDDVEVTDGGTGSIILFDKNEWLEYSYTAQESGMYSFTMNVAVGSTASSAPTVTVYADGAAVLESVLETTGGDNAYMDVYLGDIPLSAGENTIKISVATKTIRFDNFKLGYVGEQMIILSDESINKIEAEAADEAPENIVSEATGSAVVLAENGSADYTLGAKADKVYNVSLNAKGSGEISLLINGEKIASKYIDTEEYSDIFVDSIFFSKGKNTVTLKITSGTINVDYFNVELYVMEESSEMRIPAESFNAGMSTPGVQSSNHATLGRFIQHNRTNSKLAYDITIEKSGLYQVFVNSGSTADSKLSITIGGQVFSSVVAKKTAGGFYAPEDMLLCEVELEAGETTLISEWVEGGLFVYEYALKYLGNGIDLKGITYGEEQNHIVNNVVVPRGLDEIDLHFNVSPKSVDDTNVKLKCNGEAVPVKIVVDGANAKIRLLKTLDFDAELEIEVSGVKTENETSEIEKVSRKFLTGGEDSGRGSLTDVTITHEYEDFVINGQVIIEEGWPIAGRNTDLILKYPNGDVTDISGSAISDADGYFTINYSLPQGSEDGKYEVRLLTEYAAEPYKENIVFIKKSSVDEIAEDISKTTTSDEVKAIIEPKEEVLGLNLTGSLASLAVTNTDELKNDFYSCFIGKSYESIDVMIADYNKYLYYTAINYADTKATAETIFSDEEATSALGLAVERVNYLSDKKSQFIQNVFDLEKIATYDEFISECRRLLEKNIAEEMKVPVPVLSIDDISVKAEEGFKIDLKTADGYIKVKEAVFNIDSTADIFEAARLVLPENFEGKTETTESGIKVTIKPKWTLDETKDYGSLYFTAPNSEAAYTLKVAAAITLEKKFQKTEESDIETVDVTVCSEETDVALTVTGGSQGSGSDGGQSSYIPSGGGSNKGQSSDKPEKPAEPDKPVIVPDPVEPSDDVFEDLESVKWAEESIYNLLEKGIISKADKFYPLRNVTREEFVKMLVMALKVYDEKAEADFADVDENAWYAAYIASAKCAGIVNGNDDGTFGVGKEITREEMTVMIYRALGLSAEENIEKFNDDADIADYAKDAVYKVRSLGIVNGLGDNTFAPKAFANRAMSAKVIDEMLSLEVSQ